MSKEGQPDSDVHPAEIDNWKGHGWQPIEEEETPSPKRPKPKK